jgi:hypothetical protein
MQSLAEHNPVCLRKIKAADPFFGGGLPSNCRDH